MKEIWEEYLKKAENLSLYVKRLREIETLTKSDSDYQENLSVKVQDLNKMLTKRLYDYNLIIITLYGILEGFIEQLIKEYLNSLSNSISDYKKLPEVIRINHMMLSAELIKNVDKFEKFKFLSKEKIVNNLYSCISGASKYVINVDAFVNHSSNFRKEAIREIFKEIGVENITQGICRDEQFKQYFIDYENKEKGDLRHLTEDSFFEILKDIVERRNWIAHGNEVDDILSLGILANYIFYIEHLMGAIYNIVYKQYIVIQIEANDKLFLGKPEKVYNNCIIGIKNQNHKICVGMYAFSKNPITQEIRAGKILSIKYNDCFLNEIKEEENLFIGIKVDYYVKNDYDFGILI